MSDDDDFRMYLNYLPMKMIVEPCYASPSIGLRLTWVIFQDWFSIKIHVES